MNYPEYFNRSGWNAMLPARTPKPAASGSIVCDYAIVGAGYTGLAVARRLAQLQPAARIVVLDAGVAGENASGRNSGFIGSGLPTLSHSSGNDVAQQAAAWNKQQVMTGFDRVGFAWLEQIIAQHGFDAGVQKCGSFKAAATPRGAAMLEQVRKCAAAAGVTLQSFNREQLAEKTGMSFYEAGIYSESTVLVQPAALVRGLADHLPANVQLFELSKVVDLRRDKAWTLSTEGATVRAKTVVLANSAFVKNFGFLRDRLMALYTYIGITEPVSSRNAFGSMPAWGMTSAQRAGGSTLRRVGTDRFMVRSIYSYERELSPSHVRRELNRVFRARYPGLKSTEFEFVWGGLTDMTKNGAPYWGALDDGLYVSAGYNGSGVAKGTLLGKRLAEKIVGHGDPSDIERAYGRATWMPPEPFRRVGFEMTVAYKKFMAGADAT